MMKNHALFVCPDVVSETHERMITNGTISVTDNASADRLFARVIGLTRYPIGKQQADPVVRGQDVDEDST